MMRPPSDLQARFVRAPQPVPTIITRPGKTARSKPIVLKGKILGAMYWHNIVHHYRVAGDDGVLYLTPPHWLPPDPLRSARANLPQPNDLLERAEAWLRRMGRKEPSERELQEMSRELELNDAYRKLAPKEDAPA